MGLSQASAGSVLAPQHISEPLASRVAVATHSAMAQGRHAETAIGRAALARGGAELEAGEEALRKASEHVAATEEEEQAENEGTTSEAVLRPMRQAVGAARIGLEEAAREHKQATQALQGAASKVLDGGDEGLGGSAEAASGAGTTVDEDDPDVEREAGEARLRERRTRALEAMQAMSEAHEARVLADGSLDTSMRARQASDRTFKDVQSTRESARLGREVLRTD